MDPDPPLQSSSLLILIITLSFFGQIGILAILLLLILMSAAVSGSEVAFFSFSPQDEQIITADDSAASERIRSLKSKPEKLLATILIANNFINIAIVIVSESLLRNWIGEGTYLNAAKRICSTIGESIIGVEAMSRSLSFLITVVLVTFILVLFGEIAPKIFANLKNIAFAKTMSLPLLLLSKLFGPVSSVLVNWSNKIEQSIDAEKWGGSGNANKQDIDKAIQLASEQIEEAPEHVDMLKGILKFGDVAAKQIMKPRGDVIAINIETGFKKLMSTIKEVGYSRLPVYREDFDELVGILYVKDLLGLTGEGDDFKWQKLIRDQILYVPESKKIDDLLREFQSKRTHMGIVVDEYGGASGIITLEDIMEEVIGDIRDEFDEEEEVEYIKISDKHYIFEGKTLINDFCRIVDEQIEVFDEVKGDADSLAGLLLELTGFIPRRDKEISYKQFTFKVVAVSKKRIEKINVELK